jgi:hypothetical protein
MSASANPDIIDDGLVFLYDTDDGKSYKGEPTTNLLNHTTEFNNWIAAKNSGTAPTVTADTSVNPLGLVNAPMADKVYIPDDGTYPRIQQYFTPPSTNTHTFSVWIRSLSGNCDCFLGAFRNSPWSLPGSSVKSITGEWQRFTFSWTPPDTTTHLIYMGSHDTAAQKGNTLEFWGAQMEAKSHATQFTTGTRSATQGLLDRTGTSTIDISNASFDSNAQMTFDGTDDYAAIPYSSTDLDGDAIFSVEAIIKRTGTMSNGGIWGIGGDATAAGINGYVFSSAPNKITIDLWGTATFHAGVDYPLNEYVHIMWVKTATGFSTSTIIIYVNGVAYTGSNLIVMRGSSHTPNLNTSTSGKGIVVGRVGPATNSYYAQGELPILKIYNRALTTAEVLQNFNATKSRFGL